MISAPPFLTTGLSVRDLLNTHSAVLDELRRRGIVRSTNNPTGDYAEWLVSSKLGLTLTGPSAKGFDATDAGNARYQIKARHVHARNVSTQLSPIRNLAGNDFDFLVAVVFDSAWNVSLAARFTHSAVLRLANYRKHVNGHVMHVHRSMLAVSGVEDITDVLRDE